MNNLHYSNYPKLPHPQTGSSRLQTAFLLSAYLRVLLIQIKLFSLALTQSANERFWVIRVAHQKIPKAKPMQLSFNF